MRNRGSLDVSFDSIGSASVSPTVSSTRSTIDTSDLTSCNTSRQVPPSPTKDEMGQLRRKVKSYEKREAQLMNDIAYIQQKLDASKKNTDLWKQAVDGDIRPGTHYRKEIVLLKQELDKKEDDIRDREITIENLMAGNHPSHSLFFEHSQQTSVCSSILDESGDDPQAREMERLLSENAAFAHKLRMQEEENNRLRGIMADREKEQIAMKQKIAIYEKNTSRAAAFNPFHIADGQIAIKCDGESGCTTPDRSESARTTKRVMELHNELNKMTKDRNSVRHELEECKSEAMQLRRQLDDAKLNKKNELVSKLNEVKMALYNSPKEVSFASTTTNSQRERNLSDQHSEITELRKALDDSLVELEMAAEVTTEQRQIIQDLKSASKAKEADYLKLQQTLQVETESLEITKSYLRKKDSEIEQLALVVKKLETAENDITLKDKEIKGLKQTMTFWKDRYADLQKEMAEKEIEIDRLKISALEYRDNLDEESKDDGSRLFRGLKEENELLGLKTRHQTIQLQKADKLLFEKELEKSKLKTLLREMQSQLDNVNLGAIKAHALREHSIEFMNSLSSEDEERKVDDSVLILQNRVETLTSQTKDQQYEMDILVKNFAQLGVSHRELEEKSKSFENDVKFYTDEILQLYNELERTGCEMEPLNHYVKLLLVRQSSDDSTLTSQTAAMDKLESARIELVDEMTLIVEERKEFNKEIRNLHQDLEQKDDELAKLLSVDGPSETDLLGAEREEKEEMTRQRNIIFLKLKATREDLKEMQERKAYLEKTIMSQASTLHSLSNEVEEKDLKLANLGKGVAINNTLIAENAGLRENNARHLEKVNILLLEIEELKQELSSFEGTNEDLSTLKMQLQGAQTAGNNLVNTYEGRIADLTTHKNATIERLRKDLNATETQSSAKIAHLTDELNKLRGANNEIMLRSFKSKDDRIQALEQTLHVQEETVDNLRSELRQAQQKIQNPTEQRRKEMEELEQELMESKYTALNKDRECTLLKDKLEECKIEHEKETESLEQEIDRLILVNESLLNTNEKDQDETDMMLAAKQRLQQLKAVNIELKEDNDQLGARLEQALTKIRYIEAANKNVTKMETECAALKKKVADLEGVLEKIESATKRNSKLKVIKTVYDKQGKAIKSENVKETKATKSKTRGWGKKKSSGEF